MSTKILPLSSFQNEDFKDIDLDNILHQVSNGCFVNRILPYGNLAESITEITNNIGTNCHDVTRELKKEQPALEISYGYLVIGKVPIDFQSHPSWPYLVQSKDLIWIIDNLINIGNILEASRKRKDASVMEVDKAHNHIAMKLLHHSVVVDSQGNYIECIYDRYPLTGDENNEIGYIFLPHKSAQLGYSFEAYLSIF